MTSSIAIDQVHIERLLTALRQQETWHRLDAVEGLCPDLTVDQVFVAIDYLARCGQVCQRVDANQTYWLMALHPVTGEYSLASSVDSRSVKQTPNIS
ncbi:MAG: hypothetical protein KF751_05275 [Nitrospira sp.]|nr:hypothetical protein [Nitrospira sp.]MBX3348186.1 hypothetical protein [Nitrospira sp.]